MMMYTPSLQGNVVLESADAASPPSARMEVSSYSSIVVIEMRFNFLPSAKVVQYTH